LESWTDLDQISKYTVSTGLMKRDYLRDWHMTIVSIFYQHI